MQSEDTMQKEKTEEFEIGFQPEDCKKSEDLPKAGSWKEFAAVLEKLVCEDRKDKALQMCLQALQHHPHSPFPHHLMACLAADEDPQLAKSHCCAALCFDPCFHRAAWNLKALCEGKPLVFDPDSLPLQEEGRILYDGKQAAALFRLPLELAFLYEGSAENRNPQAERKQDASFSDLTELHASIPVLILQDRDALKKKTAGSLSTEQAPDFSISPVRISQLARSVFSQHAAFHDDMENQIRYGAYRLDCRQHCAYVGTTRIDLTPLEYELLSVLSLQPGQNISSDELVRQIYGTYYGSNTQALRTLIAGLRRKLTRSGVPSSLIVTVPGFGYRLAQL